MSEIAHMDFEGRLDLRTANLQIDPESIEEVVPRGVAFGIERRWAAVTNGQCLCGAYLELANRRTRRYWRSQGQPVWDGVVRHSEGCGAVSGPTIHWIYNHRRLAS